ncbi:MAG: aminodeoxychorismate synthase component I [Gammaproteobacteria bacterium]|nr:aminodeoxychorismate synthase component I [Gammaproteobacteria bacterium]
MPDLLALHSRFPQRYPHLLSSAAQGTPRARYDILFAFPGDMLTLSADYQLHRNEQKLADNDFLAALDKDWRAQLTAPLPNASNAAPPFIGGWFVFLSYELVSQIETTVKNIFTVPEFPLAMATRFPAAVIVDHLKQTAMLMCETPHVNDLLPLLQEDVRRTPAMTLEKIILAQLQEDDAQQFLDNVERAQEYIRAGDVFQVNLSRAWRAKLHGHIRPATLFRQLCAANPAPFAGLMTWGDRRAVISSSPERLVEVRGTSVRTRPIAGTYPRSADQNQDRQLSQELLRHPKERAEHVMLIDLERNDLGRICRTGSVKVQEFMTLESYRHVHHIVSEVCGQLRADISPAQVIRAVFPGGTITGCPKVRCMQIIAELERTARLAYTGSMGYINRDGSLDLNILIRTLIQTGDEIYLRAGAGIVADSIAPRELAETRAKARGMLAALGAI